MAQAMAVGTMMLSGRMPRPRAARAMMGRSQRIGAQALATGNRALAPVHAAATANARQLAKRKGR